MTITLNSIERYFLDNTYVAPARAQKKPVNAATMAFLSGFAFLTTVAVIGSNSRPLFSSSPTWPVATEVTPESKLVATPIQIEPIITTPLNIKTFNFPKLAEPTTFSSQTDQVSVASLSEVSPVAQKYVAAATSRFDKGDTYHGVANLGNAVYHLINDKGANKEAKKLASDLNRIAVAKAEHLNPSSRTVRITHGTRAYFDLWGIGTKRDIGSAYTYAQKAGEKGPITYMKTHGLLGAPQP